MILKLDKLNRKANQIYMDNMNMQFKKAIKGIIKIAGLTKIEKSNPMWKAIAKKTGSRRIEVKRISY